MLKGISVSPGRVLEKTHLLVQVHAFDLDKKSPAPDNDKALKSIDSAIEQAAAQLRIKKISQKNTNKNE
jgi:phosphoenolpyruvate-protein kinase (PTS system EI component)